MLGHGFRKGRTPSSFLRAVICFSLNQKKYKLIVKRNQEHKQRKKKKNNKKKNTKLGKIRQVKIIQLIEKH